MTDDCGQRIGASSSERTGAGQPRVIAQRYALLRELGRGGMGVVWRGEIA